jgi:ubiquinone/menaquinone biosynthesis C-methylase UbiE
MAIDDFLKAYLRERPLFLSLIRTKEAELYNRYLPLKKPVLDVGCGDGFFTKVTFAKQRNNERYLIDIGLDVKNSRIEEARKLGIYKKLVIYDGKELPFPDNSFSTVISNCVLEHIDNLELTLEEISRVLKPSGLFITAVMAKPWEENLFGNKILGNYYKKWMMKAQIHKNLFRKREWDGVFQKAGFKIGEVKGYLSPSACRLIDICHYLSLPSLINYKLFGKWVLFPPLSQIYPVDYFLKILSQRVDVDSAGGLFYVLKK